MRRNAIIIRLTALLLLLPIAVLSLGGCMGGGGRLRGERLSEEQRFENMKNDPAYIYFGGQFLRTLDIPKSEYESELFLRSENGRVTYAGGEGAVMGIDLSEWQGDVDWDAVAADGVHFVMLRIARRGYTEGGLYADPKFEEYYAGATGAGLDVGVYFFSQAITVEEAEQEAQFLLELLDGRELALPIAFDWEIPSREARTAALDGELLTDCAIQFCETVQLGGYQPMIYGSLTIAYLHYSLDRLTDYPFWLAQYADAPTFRYDFAIWQYSDSGTVAGIEKAVDLNLMFLPEQE